MCTCTNSEISPSRNDCFCFSSFENSWENHSPRFSDQLMFLNFSQLDELLRNSFLQKLASSWEQVPGTCLSYCTHAYSHDSRLLCWNFMFCVQKLWFVQCTGLEQVSHLHIAKTKGSMSFLSFGSRSFRPKTEHTSKFRGIFLLNNSYHLLSQLLMVLTLAENVLIRVDDAEIWRRRMLNRKTENKVS